MSEQNKMIVRRFSEEVENQGHFAVADELLASDIVSHTPLGEADGLESAKQFSAMLRAAFPDLHITIEDLVSEDDKVAARWTCRGTHEGQFQGMPPTGKQVEISGITISRIANGKIIEQWANPDVLGLMQQLGAVPMPTQVG